MIDPTQLSPNIAKVTGPGTVGGAAATGTPASNFADVLKSSIDEVARLQQDAAHAVEELASGRAADVSGVMTAVEKADLAFKTLLAIRSKLMDAYDEIKNMSV